MSGAETFIDHFQRVYFACHERHHRDVPRGRIVSDQQLHVLGHLDAVRQIKVGELAQHMGLSHSSVSLTIDRLARDGYVVREPSPLDGRVTFVRLTDAGQDVRDSQRVLEPERVAGLFKRMSAGEREALRVGMTAMLRAAAEENRERVKGKNQHAAGAD